MKRLKSIATLLFAVFVIAPVSGQEEAEDKIGTVNLQLLLSKYYKLADLQETYKGYEKDILEKNSVRVEAINELVKQSQEAQKSGENPAAPAEKVEEFFRLAQSLNQEAQIKENQRNSWMGRKKAAFNEKQALELGVLRKEIVAMIKAVGEAEGYDFIFDRSGSSGAGIPILSYAKDATDLTPRVLEKLNESAPVKEDEKPEEEKPKEE